MANFNPLYDTLSAQGIIAQAWHAKPPAPLALATDYTINKVKMKASTTTGALSTVMNPLDNLYVKNAGIFCNFADGLLFTQATDLYLAIGFDIDN